MTSEELLKIILQGLATGIAIVTANILIDLKRKNTKKRELSFLLVNSIKEQFSFLSIIISRINKYQREMSYFINSPKLFLHTPLESLENILGKLQENKSILNNNKFIDYIIEQIGIFEEYELDLVCKYRFHLRWILYYTKTNLESNRIREKELIENKNFTEKDIDEYINRTIKENDKILLSIELLQCLCLGCSYYFILKYNMDSKQFPKEKFKNLIERYYENIKSFVSKPTEITEKSEDKSEYIESVKGYLSSLEKALKKQGSKACEITDYLSKIDNISL